MRYFLISIICVLLSACKVTTVKNFIKTEINEDDAIQNLYFSNSEFDYVYKSDIAVYGNEFSGILIIKKIALQKHRMVFTSQFGSTFFDIEFEKDTYKINTIVEQLDRKIILNTLLRDFALLVKEKEIVAQRYFTNTYTIFENQKNKRSNYYFYNQKDTSLDKIVHTTKYKEKFTIFFRNITQNQIAENIRIDHKNIKLSIELNLLKK